jgi:transcriptional regulator of arginine metabolism
MKQNRRQAILDIVSSKAVGTQDELAAELARRGIVSTQSSVSRDIGKLGLIKINGAYSAPSAQVLASGPITNMDTAGDNLIVVTTDVGQAQHAALMIDWAKIAEIVGTVAGDDTILVAVKNAAAQKIAMKRILGLFMSGREGLEVQRRAVALPGRAPKPKKRVWA